MQVMRIRQRDDRYRKKKKKQQQQQQGSAHHHQAKQLHMEPAYRRKPNPIRRYDTDVLSPVGGRLTKRDSSPHISFVLIYCFLFFLLRLLQSYIQSFRDRQVQAQPYPGRLVGGSSAVVDVGYDLTTPLTATAGPSLRA